MLLRSLALMLAVSPVACMKIDWAYTDHRSSGDSAKEGAAELGEGEGTLIVDLPAAVDLGEDSVQFKLWPVGDCEGTEDETTLSAEDFPYSVVVDATCDYKATFALGEGAAGEPVEVLGEDLTDAGEDGVIVDVQLAKAGGAEEQAEQTAESTDSSTATATAVETSPATQPEATDPNAGALGVKEFRIPAGTGRGAWNQQGNPIVARIGDVVRIYNDDNVTHQLHTNGRPCRHGSPIRPGSFGECVIESQFVGDTYDHLTDGKVFFQATR